MVKLKQCTFPWATAQFKFHSHFNKEFCIRKAIGLRLWQEFAEWQCYRLAPALRLSSFGAIHNKHGGWLGLGAQQGLWQRFCYIKGMLNPVIVLERKGHVLKTLKTKSNRINDNYPTLYFPQWKCPVLDGAEMMASTEKQCIFQGKINKGLILSRNISTENASWSSVRVASRCLSG